MKAIWPLIQTILLGRGSIIFFIGCVLSLGFSIAVILSTVGLMDGFESALRSSLTSYNSDYVLTSYQGFFEKEKLESPLRTSEYTNILRVEAFAVSDVQSTGVFIHGIERKSFKNTTSKDLNLMSNEVAIGSQLSKTFNLKLGDLFKIILSSGSKGAQGSTSSYDVKIKQIVSHGIYEKDLRFMYMNEETLRNFLGYRPGVYNKTLVKKRDEFNYTQDLDFLKKELNAPFNIQENWKEYSSLIEAVGVEKRSISLVLQIIVIVSIFNILAFVLFLIEKKSQDFFLLRSLGVSKKKLSLFWIITFILIWFGGVITSLFLTNLFDYILQNVSFFELPGDVYVLSKLSLMLDISDYMIVFATSLIWVLLIGFIMVRRVNKKMILTGLRQEFS